MADTESRPSSDETDGQDPYGLASLSDDEVLKLVNKDEDDKTEDDARAEPTDQPEVEADVQDTNADESTEQSEDSSQDDAVPSEADLLKLQVDQLKAQAEEGELWRKRHDSLTGKYGQLKQEYERFKSGMRVTDEPDQDLADSRLARVDARLREFEERERIESDLREAAAKAHSAMESEARAFLADHPDFSEHADYIKAYFDQRSDRVQSIISSLDSDFVRDGLRTMLRNAYAEARLTKARTLAEARQKEEQERQRRRKVSASASTSGGTRVAEALKPKSLKDLSDAELKALVDSM